MPGKRLVPDGFVIQSLRVDHRLSMPVLVPSCRETLPAIAFRKNKGRPRRSGAGCNRWEWMVLLGLSPWSCWPKCDICQNTPEYMVKHEIDGSIPVMVYGRYAAHFECYEQHRGSLVTLQLPKLDYRLVVSARESNSATMLLGRMAIKLSRVRGHA